MSLFRRTARRLFAISPREGSFEVRRFRWDSDETRQRLEEIARTFARGYHAALEADPPELTERLDQESPAARGWAYEGAGLGAAILDTLTAWRSDRLGALLAGAGDSHAYIVHVGAGWLLGRLPVAPRRLLRRLDPVLGWLALDGFGFHEGFFHSPAAVRRQRVPARLAGYARRAFDQGLGRSLWFVEGAGVARIAATIGDFPPQRRPDLWSGAGLACGYAGGIEPDDLLALRRAADLHTPELAQGVAFAAEARSRAGHIPAQTELACRAIWEAGAAEVAAIARAAGQDLPPDGELPAFEIWRRRIQNHFDQAEKGVRA